MRTLCSVFASLVMILATDVFAQDRPPHDLTPAIKRFFEGKNVLQSDYRRDLAITLAAAERVEVYLLDFETKESPFNYLNWYSHLEKNEFPILPDVRVSKILKTVTLNAEQMTKLIPKLQEVVGVQGDVGPGPLCHFPIHGIRVFVENEVIFQSSFCWECGNFAVSYPDGDDWVAITQKHLFEAFSELMPIPPSEKDRFEKMIKEMKSKGQK